MLELSLIPLEKLLTSFFHHLECDNIPYAVLRNYEELPKSVRIDGDIDILTDSEKLNDIACLLKKAAKEAGCSVVQAFHGAGWLEYRIAKTEENYLFAIQFHIHGEEARLGMPIFDAESILARRRKYKNFYISNPVDEAMLSWFTRVLSHGKGKAAYREPVVSAARQHPDLAMNILSQSFGERLGKELYEAFLNNNPEKSEHLYKTLNRTIVFQAIRKGPVQWRLILKRVFEGIRWRIPPISYGVTLALVGPDGCGKSAVAYEVLEALSHIYLTGPPKRLHLRPGLLPRLADLPHPSRWFRSVETSSPVTAPHSAVPSGIPASLIRLLYYAADYIIGYMLKIAPYARWRRTLVIFERYYYDFIVDPLRARIKLPEWIAKSLLKFIPQPDIVIYLDAPPEVILSRKQEVPADEVKRQVHSYRALMNELSNAYIIDATKPVSEIVREICRKVIEKTEAKNV